jgi:hypothetical protein
MLKQIIKKEVKMKKGTALIAIAAILLIGITGCGKNPFGPGAAGGLDLFAKIGKAMGKPSAINEEENDKKNAKEVVSKPAAKRYLAKGLRTEDPWQTGNGIIPNDDGSLTYWETVSNKPDEHDKLKLFTGRAEVVFTYNGPAPAQPSDLNVGLIGDIISWHANGSEVKTWKKDALGNMETNSINLLITFAQGDIQQPCTIKPGVTTAWGKNISASVELGRGDTASFKLEPITDDINHIQYGEGHFYDAYNDDGESRSVDFKLEIHHKNNYPELSGCPSGNPYLRYEDNEGVVTFEMPWGETGDDLFFHIHFYPAVGTTLGYRVVKIYKNDINGELLYEVTVDEHDNELEVKDHTTES